MIGKQNYHLQAMYIFDSDLVWRIPFNNYLRVEIRELCVGNFNLKWLSIEFLIPNLIPEIFKTNVSNQNT